MFSLSLKAFLRRRYILVLLAAILLLPIAFLLYKCFTAINPDWLRLTGALIQLAPLQFLLLLFASMTYARSYTHRLSEIQARTMLSGSWKIYLFSWLILELLVALIFILFMAASLAILFFYYRPYAALMAYLWRLGVLYFFLIPQLAIVLGFILSRFKHLIYSYVVALVIFVVMMPISKEYVYRIYDQIGRGENPLFYQVFELTRFWPILTFFEHAYGIPAESYLFWNALFSLLLLLAIYGLKQSRKLGYRRWRFASALSLLLALPSLLVAAQPASKYLLDSYSSYLGGGNDQRYYYAHEQVEEQATHQGKLRLEKVDLDLDIKRQLKAKATIAYSSEEEILPQAGFTLYHGYRVRSVRDQEGRNIAFHQISDAIYLDEAISGKGALTFEYEGHGYRYYSNDQGIFLPATFCYYPIPGLQRLWDVDDATMLPVVGAEEIAYSLRISYAGKVYCNLPQTQQQFWEGKARGLTILSGLYREKQIDDKTYILAYDNYDFEKVRQLIASEVQDQKEPWQQKASQAKWIAQLPKMNLVGNYERNYFDSEQALFAYVQAWSHTAHVYDSSPRKRHINELLRDFKAEDPYLFEKLASIQYEMGASYRESGEKDPNYPKRIYLRTQKIREYLDDQTIKDYLQKYLDDPNDNRGGVEVIDDLEKLVQQQERKSS